jgi:hypothetical protein
VSRGDLLEQIRLFVEGLAANLDVHAEVSADVKRRVNVDEFQPASFLDLAAERARFQRGKNQLVVAPDKFVRPAFELASANIEAEFFVIALFLSWFVNVFERLKRKNGGADFAGFAAPHEFNFTLIIKEQEAIFFRQRLSLVDQLDEIALLRVAELVAL